MLPVGFTTPLFLTGVAAALVVVLIHLLKRPKTIRMTFSSLRFFAAAAVSAKRSRSLRKWLLLATRILLVMLIALIFAGPYPKNDPLQRLYNPDNDLCIIIDNSSSMEYRQEPLTPSQQAYATLDSIIALQQHGRRVSLYVADSGKFVSYVSGTTLRPSPGAVFDKKQCVAASKQAAAASPPPAFIILSDFQQPFTAFIDSLFTDTTFGTTPVVYCPLTPKAPWNISVAAVEAVSGHESQLQVRLVSHAPIPVSGLVSASVNNMHTTPQTCTIAPHSDTVVTLPVAALTIGTSGYATFSCNDPLPFDDTGYVTVRSRSERSILVVGALQSTFPLRTAIMAMSSARVPRRVTSCTHEEFSIATMVANDIIIVGGGSGAGETVHLLATTTPSGKQAVITAPDSTFYATTPLVWKTVASPLTIRLSDTVSTLWRGFPSPRTDEVAIYGYTNALAGTPVAFLANGTPLVTRRVDKQGRTVVAVASPLDATTHNNLCETAFFVPFIDRLLGLLETTLTTAETPWTCGAEVKNPFYTGENRGILLEPSGAPLKISARQPFFTVYRPGVYQVCPEGKTAYFAIATTDSAESAPQYRLPAMDAPQQFIRKILSKEQLLAYCSQHTTSLWQIVPWILLGTLFLAEVLLREKRTTTSNKKG